MKNKICLSGLALFFCSLVLQAEDKNFASVTSLEIENITGDVELMPSSGSELVVSSDDLKRFSFSQSGGTLSVTQEPSKPTVGTYNGGGVSVVSIGNGNVSNVTIGNQSFSTNTEKPAKLAIKIPAKKIPVHIKNAAGNWQIGELGSSLSISLTTADVAIAKASDLDVAITGSGSVILDKDVDKAVVNILGTGDFKANSGIGNLDASIHGTGDIEVNGTVNDAKIVLEGVGGIKINRLLHKPNIVSHGVGNIEITNKDY